MKCKLYIDILIFERTDMMRKRLISTLLSICILIPLVPDIKFFALGCVCFLDKDLFRSQIEKMITMGVVVLEVANKIPSNWDDVYFLNYEYSV